MTKNYNLIKGNNLKTCLPIVYAAPIYSESYVPQINRSCLTSLLSPNILQMNTGFTHMSNNGLSPDNESTCQAFFLKFNHRVGLDTVYDPRFTGYCDDQWRAYEDDFGRIQWNYSDIDEIKISQNIERNQLDNAKDMAEQHFTNMQMIQRELAQKDFISKYASDRAQRALFPIHTMGRKL